MVAFLVFRASWFEFGFSFLVVRFGSALIRIYGFCAIIFFIFYREVKLSRGRDKDIGSVVVEFLFLLFCYLDI